MVYQIVAILILSAFYFAKIFIQKRQSIKTNQMGIGDKPKRVLFIERVMSVATVTMKNSWRVGIPEEKTALITDGIYKWSRNPAFAGFDLLYLSICLMFFNIPLAVVSVWAAVRLHLQILQQEAYMHDIFGEEYEQYRKHILRYLGKR